MLSFCQEDMLHILNCDKRIEKEIRVVLIWAQTLKELFVDWQMQRLPSKGEIPLKLGGFHSFLLLGGATRWVIIFNSKNCTTEEFGVLAFYITFMHVFYQDNIMSLHFLMDCPCYCYFRNRIGAPYNYFWKAAK